MVPHPLSAFSAHVFAHRVGYVFAPPGEHHQLCGCLFRVLPGTAWVGFRYHPASRVPSRPSLAYPGQGIQTTRFWFLVLSSLDKSAFCPFCDFFWILSFFSPCHIPISVPCCPPSLCPPPPPTALGLCERRAFPSSIDWKPPSSLDWTYFAR